MKRAVVIGATGLIGNELVGILLSNNHFEHITLLVRKEIKYQHPKLEIRIIDFDNKDSYFKDTDSFTDAFCCLGTTMNQAGSKEAFYKVDFTYCLNFAKGASILKVSDFHIVSAMGSNKNSSIYYNKVKGEIEEAISELAFNSINIYKPSLLLGNRKEFRLGERIGQAIMLLFGFIFIGSLKKYKAIPASQVAKAMYANAFMSKKGINRFDSGLLWNS